MRSGGIMVITRGNEDDNVGSPHMVSRVWEGLPSPLDVKTEGDANEVSGGETKKVAASGGGGGDSSLTEIMTTAEEGGVEDREGDVFAEEFTPPKETLGNGEGATGGNGAAFFAMDGNDAALFAPTVRSDENNNNDSSPSRAPPLRPATTWSGVVASGGNRLHPLVLSSSSPPFSPRRSRIERTTARGDGSTSSDPWMLSGSRFFGGCDSPSSGGAVGSGVGAPRSGTGGSGSSGFSPAADNREDLQQQQHQLNQQQPPPLPTIRQGVEGPVTPLQSPMIYSESVVHGFLGSPSSLSGGGEEGGDTKPSPSRHQPQQWQRQQSPHHHVLSRNFSPLSLGESTAHTDRTSPMSSPSLSPHMTPLRLPRSTATASSSSQAQSYSRMHSQMRGMMQQMESPRQQQQQQQHNHNEGVEMSIPVPPIGWELPPPRQSMLRPGGGGPDALSIQPPHHRQHPEFHGLSSFHSPSRSQHGGHGGHQGAGGGGGGGAQYLQPQHQGGGHHYGAPPFPQAGPGPAHLHSPQLYPMSRSPRAGGGSYPSSPREHQNYLHQMQHPHNHTQGPPLHHHGRSGGGGHKGSPSHHGSMGSPHRHHTHHTPHHHTLHGQHHHPTSSPSQQPSSPSSRSSTEILKTLLRKKACLYEPETSRAVSLVTWLVGRRLALSTGFFTRQMLQSGVHAAVSSKIVGGKVTRTKVNRCMQIILNSCFHYIIPRPDGSEESGEAYRACFGAEAADDIGLLDLLSPPWGNLMVDDGVAGGDDRDRPRIAVAAGGTASDGGDNHGSSAPASAAAPSLDDEIARHRRGRSESWPVHPGGSQGGGRGGGGECADGGGAVVHKRAVLLCFNENVRSASDVFRCHDEFIRDVAHTARLNLTPDEWRSFFSGTKVHHQQQFHDLHHGGGGHNHHPHGLGGHYDHHHHRSGGNENVGVGGGGGGVGDAGVGFGSPQSSAPTRSQLLLSPGSVAAAERPRADVGGNVMGDIGDRGGTATATFASSFVHDVDAYDRMPPRGLCQFRTSWCAKRYDHDPSLCAFAHVDVNQGWLRRDPCARAYRPVMCPRVRPVEADAPSDAATQDRDADCYFNSCPRGIDCDLAHSREEIMYHPENYKRQPCPNSASCCSLRDVCPNVHDVTNHSSRRTGVGVGAPLPESNQALRPAQAHVFAPRHHHGKHNRPDFSPVLSSSGSVKKRGGAGGSGGVGRGSMNSAVGFIRGHPGGSPTMYLDPAPHSEFEKTLQLPGLQALFRDRSAGMRAMLGEDGDNYDDNRPPTIATAVANEGSSTATIHRYVYGVFGYQLVLERGEKGAGNDNKACIRRPLPAIGSRGRLTAS